MIDEDADRVSTIMIAGIDKSFVAKLWAAAASVTALWSMEQFARKWAMARASHTDFYLSYIAARVTGLRDHWMTFAGEQMIAILLVTSLLLFSSWQSRKRWWLALAFALIAISLVISLTRGVWIATLVGLLYLVGAWKPRWLLAAPVVLTLLISAGPQRSRP